MPYSCLSGKESIFSPLSKLLAIGFGGWFFLFAKLKKIFFSFIYFWLCWVFIAAQGLSLVTASGGSSLVAVHRFLIVVASLAAEHRP